MKDDTDMALAVELGIERGCRDFYIYGGLGGRLDHTLANIQLIVRLARRGYSAFLISARETITAIYNGGIRFPADYEGTISVFAYGGIATGVTETGLLYKLIDAKVFDDVTIGVSNEYTGIPSCVEVKSGTIIVMWQGNLDKKPPELYNFPL
jgi:thiamine pyrophosphokinase